MVVTKAFAKKNAKVLKTFLSDYEKSLAKTLENPMEAGKLCEEFGLGLAAGIVAKSVPKANYVFISAGKTDAKKKVEELLNVFLVYDASSIGGKLPDKNFYYK